MHLVKYEVVLSGGPKNLRHKEMGVIFPKPEPRRREQNRLTGKEAGA